MVGSLNHIFKSNYYKRVEGLWTDMYWEDASPTQAVHQLLWDIPPNTEYVVKNGNLIWRVRGKGKNRELRKREGQCTGTQENYTKIEDES